MTQEEKRIIVKGIKVISIVYLLISVLPIFILPIIISLPPVLKLSYESEYSQKKVTGEISLIEPSEYDKIIEETREITKYALCIFPSSIEKSQNHFWFVEPFPSKRSNRTEYKIEIYLENEFTDYENYEREVNRLMYIKLKERTSIRVNDLFDLDSIVTYYNINSEFEYALLEEETKTIRYVYLLDIGNMDNINFTEKYAPHKVLEDSSFPKDKIKNHGYSLFY